MKVPEVAPNPQDRKTKKKQSARKAEVDGFVDIEQCGVSLRIPVGREVPLDAAMAFMDGNEMQGTKLLLGDVQWHEFMAARPTVGDFQDIGQKLSDLLGN